METVKYNVAVHKAGLPMKPGETVGQFTSDLRRAGTDHLRKQLNLSAETSSMYMAEVMADVAIFDVWKRNSDDVSRYYAVKFTRNKSNEFEFSTIQEVERFTGFRAKATASIKKRLVAESTGDEAWVKKEALFAGVI